MLVSLSVGAHPPSTQILHRHRTIGTLRVEKGIVCIRIGLIYKAKGTMDFHIQMGIIKSPKCNNLNKQD